MFKIKFIFKPPDTQIEESASTSYQESVAQESTQEKTGPIRPGPSISQTQKRRNATEIKEVKTQMDEAFKAITVASKRQQDYDDTDFFCQMLAKKVQGKLSKEMCYSLYSE